MSERMNKERAREILEKERDTLFDEIEHYSIGGVPIEQSARELLEALDIAIDSLDNEWVDVRDRLPSESGYYLVSIKGARETTTWFYGISSDEKGWDEFEGHEDIIAWKPLPKPYERKENK